MNRLIHSTSPYLRQHAGNPADWQEWGDEAFAEARRREVPILLSAESADLAQNAESGAITDLGTWFDR